MTSESHSPASQSLDSPRVERAPVLMKCGCVAQSVLTARGGVKLDPPIPSCITHDCTEIADAVPDLTGRMAECAYMHRNPQYTPQPPQPSAFGLAFFEYQGPGSPYALEYCLCGYHKAAHKDADKCPAIPARTDRRRAPSGKFTAQGPSKTDKFYCGCMGWD